MVGLALKDQGIDVVAVGNGEEAVYSARPVDFHGEGRAASFRSGTHERAAESLRARSCLWRQGYGDARRREPADGECNAGAGISHEKRPGDRKRKLCGGSASETGTATD